MNPPVRIVPMTDEHARDVLDIYRLGIATGQATFETVPPTWAQFTAARPPGHRYVAVDGRGTVLGWVGCAPVSDRCVYVGVVEHAIYVRPDQHRQGIGRALLGALITGTEAAGIWTIQAGIFPENTASLALHHRCGFRTVGVRERLGKSHDRWRDVLLVERRSPTIT